MLHLLAANWWVFVVRGVLAILFGLGAFIVPGVTLAVLVIMYGAYVLADGVIAAVAAFGARKAGEEFPWLVFVIGLAGVLAGVVTFVYPGLTALVLLYLIAAWHIVRGVFEIMTAIRLRREIQGEGWLILGGIASVVFGMILYARPGAGAVALLWMIGAFAIAFGIIEILLAFKLKRFAPMRP
jgi:uncharacterized membrane protein HdeD (DUF308 family)